MTTSKWKEERHSCDKCPSSDGAFTDHKGWTHCFSCDEDYRTDKVEEKRVTSKLSMSQVHTYPIKGDPKRGIPEEILTEFGTRASVNETTGEVDTVFYKYITGYKQRKLPKTFSWVGKPDGCFGKERIKGDRKYLIVTEGEEDAQAAAAILSKFGGSEVRLADVVSLPNGAALDTVTRGEIDFFSNYSRIYLALDNDPVGDKARDEIADWLCGFAEVRFMKHDPTIGKDASDYWKAGKTKEWRLMIKDAEVYSPEGIVNGTEISLDDILTPIPKGATLPFTGMQEKLHGVRKAEIVTVCAGSGIGKSTLVREITKSLIEQGHSVANVALEDQMNVAAQALVALDMDIPLYNFRLKPPSAEEVAPHREKMIANGRTFFFKHFGGLNSENLLNKLYYYARSEAVDFIVLDHLSMVVSSSKSNNERKDIDTLMTNLAKMVVETGVGLIQIVHLKRTGGDKSFGKGGEVELTDLRGSAALEQLSWAVVGMERDQQSEDKDFSRVRILKNRTVGFTGLADTLKYNTETGRLENVILEGDVPSIGDIDEICV
jgi:twinkle protein